MKKEEWKPFAHRYYAVSNRGRVCRNKPGPGTWCGRELKAHPDGDGYLRVSCHFEGKSQNYHVSGLVARKFIGPRPKGKEVNHKDLNKQNNYYKNLEYTTHIDNIRHAIDNGVPYPGSGEGRGNGKLKIVEVKKIRKLYKQGYITQKRLSKKFGVTEMAIWHIVNNRTWKKVA